MLRRGGLRPYSPSISALRRTEPLGDSGHPRGQPVAVRGVGAALRMARRAVIEPGYAAAAGGVGGAVAAYAPGNVARSAGGGGLGCGCRAECGPRGEVVCGYV